MPTTPSFVRKLREIYFSESPAPEAEPGNPFCLMPWIHLHITQNGTVAPCCLAPWDEESSFGNINRQSFDEVWQGPAIRDFRLKMLNGESDHRCERCYDQERSGVHSLRQSILKLYGNHLWRTESTEQDGKAPNAKPVYWDFRLSNICNFKCRICGPHSSSKWYEDAQKLGWDVKDKAITISMNSMRDLLQNLERYIDELEEIYFAGGEPLLIDAHYEILELLNKRGRTDVLIRYSTNFSEFNYKDKDVFALWNQFERIFVTASIDDIGERAEHQRKGQNWESTVRSRHEMLEKCPNAYFMLSPTISIWNAFGVSKLHQTFVEEGLINVEDIWPNILTAPEYMNIRVLDAKMKADLNDLYQEHSAWIMTQPTEFPRLKAAIASEFKNIAAYSLSEDWSEKVAEFRSMSADLDRIRFENSLQLYPELKDLLS